MAARSGQGPEVASRQIQVVQKAHCVILTGFLAKERREWPTILSMPNSWFLCAQSLGVWHGHSRTWGQSSQDMQNIFKRKGIVRPTGNVIK